MGNSEAEAERLACSDLCVCPHLYTVRYGTHLRRTRVGHGRLHAESTAALYWQEETPIRPFHMALQVGSFSIWARAEKC